MIFEIAELDKYDVKTVRYESDREGHGFINKLLADFNSGGNRYDREGEKLIGFNMDGKIAAVCGLSIDEDDPRRGRLNSLFVLRRFRHRGIGRKLVTYLLRHAAKHFEAVTLDVSGTPHEEGVDTLCEGLGFKRIMNKPGYTHIYLFRNGEET